jgi:hypothetical protein
MCTMTSHTPYSDTRIAWVTVVLYTGVIFATLADVVLIMDVIERSIGTLLNTMLSILPLIIMALLLGHLIIVKKETQPWRYLLMIFVIVSASVMLRFIPYPAEKVHLVEYGALGWMIYRAVLVGGGGIVSGFFWTMALALTIGTADEIVQSFLPMRVFDIRDIIINFHSGVLGAVVCTVFSPQLDDEPEADPADSQEEDAHPDDPAGGPPRE